MGTTSITLLLTAISLIGLQLIPQIAAFNSPHAYIAASGCKPQWDTTIYQVCVPAVYRYRKYGYLRCARFCWRRIFGPRFSTGLTKKAFYKKIRAYEKCVKLCLYKTGIRPKSVVPCKDFIAKLFWKKPYVIYKIQVPAAYRKYAKYYIKYFKAALQKVFGKGRFYRKRWYTKSNEVKFRKYLAKYLKKLAAKPWYKPSKGNKVPVYYYIRYNRRAGLRSRGRRTYKKRSFSQFKPHVYIYSGSSNPRWQTEIYQISVPVGYRYNRNGYLKCAIYCWKRIFGNALSKGYKKNVFYNKIRLYEKCVKKCLTKHGIKPKKIIRQKDFIARLFIKKPRTITKIEVPAKYRKYARYYIYFFKRVLSIVFGRKQFYSKSYYTKSNEAKFRKYLKKYLKKLVTRPWYKPSFIFSEPVYYYFGHIVSASPTFSGAYGPFNSYRKPWYPQARAFNKANWIPNCCCNPWYSKPQI